MRKLAIPKQSFKKSRRIFVMCALKAFSWRAFTLFEEALHLLRPFSWTTTFGEPLGLSLLEYRTCGFDHHISWMLLEFLTVCGSILICLLHPKLDLT